ncbi:MAG: Crp/Fnr family transcriptional regulator [Caulobacter sp. 12-67-6]|nr:MAG: Crp/Fnr family transcriptional regulator [Caulobacter sp. 12-67-6]OYX72487.1 MAG: Crp/Fnr family transcriptional regulator [Caulobacter sp. 32-67-35]OYX91170.1 MAG: Crp/Fnr family transcriptional regulator [Novosphingobium sp. 35-62-5]
MTGLNIFLKNRLLAALPPEEFALASPHLSPVELERGRLLYDPGDRIETVYFPHDCVISLMTLMANGAAIESAAVGREGAVGLMAVVAPRVSLNRVIVQAPGLASRIGASVMHDLSARLPTLRSLIDRHNEALFGHAIQSAACNALHAVEARFCRWLLSCDDRIDTNMVQLTQEVLADMLGVQRTTVTAVAGSLQTKGLIRYRRGVVDILDRAGLEAMACECYGAVRRGYERLLPASFG